MLGTQFNNLIRENKLEMRKTQNEFQKLADIMCFVPPSLDEDQGTPPPTGLPGCPFIKRIHEFLRKENYCLRSQESEGRLGGSGAAGRPGSRLRFGTFFWPRSSKRKRDDSDYEDGHF